MDKITFFISGCDAEHYGENCESLCTDRHCKDDQTCDTQLGFCWKGCISGWTGKACAEKIKTG